MATKRKRDLQKGFEYIPKGISSLMMLCEDHDRFHCDTQQYVARKLWSDSEAWLEELALGTDK